ncbi:ATP synthase F1 subunit delta [bacterium]|jgi:F-type H+-transporting ATPase subunit delta|nr:ATP synthase F1 subunit delta [bacterium]
MRNRKIATRYGNALLDSTIVQECMVPVAQSYRAVAEIMDTHPELVHFLEGPQVTEQEKKELLKSLFGEQIEELLLNFFYLLIDRNRVEFLRDIEHEFALLVEIEQGQTRVLVTTAIALSDDLESALMAKLETVTGGKVVMKKKIDTSVLGGVCITMGDKVIDGTLRTGLGRLRSQFSRTDVR